MAFVFPNIDPVILHFGDYPFKITWYSVSYITGILLGWLYIKYLNRIGYQQPALPKKIIDDLITSLIIGIVIGGRLGYVLFYDLDHNMKEPLNIFRTWEGGMSFHGGLIGVIVASFIYCKIHKIYFFRIMDLLACATPIGLFFGRIANFINAELKGRVTTSSWGVIFPGDEMPRHASQLYESCLEGVALFLILYFLFTRSKIQQYQGMLSGLFLLLYALFRSLIENYRQPDEHLGFIIGDMTMGQILSLPMIIFGFAIIAFSLKKAK